MLVLKVFSLQAAGDYIGISGTTQLLQLESTEFSINANADINGNADISGTLGVTGTSTFTGDATFNGAVNINDVLHLVPSASAPASPNNGDLYVNSTDNHIYCRLNGTWVQLDN